MERLILVRHGETSKNVSGGLHKSGDPEKLNQNGKSQIARTAKRLEEFKPMSIYSSNEARAIESAEILATALGAVPTVIPGLEERDWGIFAGRPKSDVQVVLDGLDLEERYLYVPEGGESWKDFETRLILAIDGIMTGQGTKTVVTHGGAIRALMPHLLGVDRRESFKYNPDNASITIFEYSEGKVKNVVVNDTSHLE